MLYIVNKHTKEHRRYMDAEEWADADCVVVGADPGGWIEWGGGECPLPDNDEVQIRTKVGIKNRGIAGGFRWAKQYRGGDIIAYRPILDEPEAPGWNGDCPPPVGCVCEGHVQDTAGQWRWVVVEVLMQKENECAVHVPYMGVLRWCDEFRPIRSKYARTVDDMADIIAAQYGGTRKDLTEAARALYRAGYRKEVEE